MEKRCVISISLQATMMRKKNSIYFLTESLMRSIAARFYHFREHVFQKETRVDSSILFQHVPENTDSSQMPSLPRSRFWDVTQRSPERFASVVIPRSQAEVRGNNYSVSVSFIGEKKNLFHSSWRTLMRIAFVLFGLWSKLNKNYVFMSEMSILCG